MRRFKLPNLDRFQTMQYSLLSEVISTLQKVTDYLIIESYRTSFPLNCLQRLGQIATKHCSLYVGWNDLYPFTDSDKFLNSIISNSITMIFRIDHCVFSKYLVLTLSFFDLVSQHLPPPSDWLNVCRNSVLYMAEVPRYN